MVWFENGEQKIFDVKPYLNKGVFSQLKDRSLFASVRNGQMELTLAMTLLI